METGAPTRAIKTDAAEFSILNVLPADSGDYDVVISGTCGTTTSDAVTVTVDALPRVVVEPTDVAVCETVALELSVVASGAEPLQYQWIHDGVDVPGATASTLPLVGVLADAS